jgi:hypothetical protein
MKSIYKYQYLIQLCLLSLLFLSSHKSFAEPYLAYKNNLKCMACHVNPNGGGLRSKFGRTYGEFLLPKKTTSIDTSKIAEVSPFLTLGGDLRFNANFSRADDDNNRKSFEVSSGQVYLALAIPETKLTLYLDQQIAPGSAINREAFIMYKFDNGNFLKAGKMFLPYGLRIEDDSAFIRQATGMNFDNSDNGVELGIDYQNTTLNFFIANGTSQSTNDDDAFLYGVRAEHLFSNYRIGTTALLNDKENDTQQFNVYGGATFGDFTLLAEIDYLILNNANQQTFKDIKQLVSLMEVNYQYSQGVNLKFTAEYFDSDTDIDENENTRYSFVTEFTPFSSLQLRGGYRVQDGIPQKPQDSNHVLFLQSHFYF